MRGNHSLAGVGQRLGLAVGWFLLAATTAARAADGGAGTGPAAEPTAAERQMMEQIRQLQGKVDRLEARQPTTAPAGRPPLPVADVAPGDRLARQRRGDADPMDTFKPVPPLSTATATTGPAGGDDLLTAIAAGWNGNQFVLQSADGNFTFHPGLVADFRGMATYRQAVPAGGGGSEVKAGGRDDTQSGFDVSRLRLLFDGTLFHRVSYLVQFSADQGQSLTLLDAAVSYRIGDGPFTLKAGQFKDPVWHERNVSEAYQLAVDRTLIEQFLGGGPNSRVQGAAITYDQGRTRAQLVAHDGYGSQNTKFFDAGGVPTGLSGAAGVSPADYGLSTRAEYMLIGTRTPEYNPYLEYDQFSSLHARQDVLVVGGGADYSQAGANDVILHSADVQYNRADGFSAYAAYYGSYRKLKTNQGLTPLGFSYTNGFEAQAAQLIGGRLEPFARYDTTHFDPDVVRQVTGLRSHVLQEVTVGANYYLYGQKLKVTADATYLPNGSPGDADAAGVLKDSGRNEVVGRVQVQLAI